jgi:hypothetical protein
MFIKLAKHRSYQYTPRYYDPAKENKKGPRFRIRRQSHQAKSKSLIWMFALLAFIVYLIYMFTQLQK